MPSGQSTPTPSPLPTTSGNELPPRRFRFSLRTLFRVMTTLAIACGLVTALPVVMSQILLGAIWIAAIGWLVTGIFFASNDQRAFCIGASVVVSSMWTGAGARFIDSLSQLLGAPFATSIKAGLWLDFLLVMATAFANGWLCIRAKHYFQRQIAD